MVGHRRFTGQSLPRRTAMGAVATAAFGAIAGDALRAIEPFDRPAPGRLRLGLAAYSLRQHLADDASTETRIDLRGFVDYCHDHGVAGAELTSYYFPRGVDDRFIAALRRHCHLRGVTVTGGAVRNDFCSPDAVRASLDHVRTWIDFYALLGAPVIRIFAGDPVPGEPIAATLERCAAACSEACRHAADRGVMLALENHGGVTARADDLLEIVRRVDSPAFGINFDSGNFTECDDPYAELEAIAPYAVNAQIKVEMHPRGRPEKADLGRVLGILRRAGYSGWAVLEYEAAAPPLEAIPGWLDALRPLVDG